MSAVVRQEGHPTLQGVYFIQLVRGNDFSLIVYMDEKQNVIGLELVMSTNEQKIFEHVINPNAHEEEFDPIYFDKTQVKELLLELSNYDEPVILNYVLDKLVCNI